MLKLEGVGPASQIELNLASRLNLITGDNGLGKTFLLECAWWALTGIWAGYPARPRQDAARDVPRITFRIGKNDHQSGREQIVKYNWDQLKKHTFIRSGKEPLFPH
jgi:recombinational DNA repair ATPase RecF